MDKLNDLFTKIITKLNKKVDSVEGKQLSTEDFTAALKAKLEDIEDNAQVNTIESISVNGTPVAPDEQKNVEIKAYNEDNKPEVGGRNLVLDSGVEVSKPSYLLTSYKLSEKWDSSQCYSVRIWGKLDSNKDHFIVSGTGQGSSRLNDNKDGTFSAVFYPPNPEDTDWGISSSLNVYAAPNNEAGDSTISKIKLEKGNIFTDWSPAPEDLAFIDEQKILAQIANRTYQGTDLTVKFKSEIDGSFNGNPWAWIQSRINNANWDGIHICDYIPFTTAGLETNVTMRAQIAGIDTYYQYSNPPVPHHIDFITREIWPTLHTFNLVNYNNGTAAQNYPWLASDMYLWLNSKAGSVPNATTVNPETTEVDYTTDGVYYFLPEELKAVIIEKRFLLEIRYNASNLLTTSSAGWDWQDEGKLWLPTEMEVYGTNVWGGAGYSTGGGIQYPIFANSMNQLKYGNRSRCHWWLSTPSSGNSTSWCYVYSNGAMGTTTATHTWTGAPVCFRIASTVKTADMPVEGPEMMDEPMQHEME